MIVHVATALGVSPHIETVGEQAGDVRRTYADVSKAQRLFDYRPSVSFEDGTRRFAEWFLSERACAGVFE
jgi:UDP-glucuronate 4-epimerase